jgi:hypothetical protein
VKIGTDNPIKTGFALVLGIIALLVLYRTYFGGESQAAPATATARPATKQNAKPISSLDPTLRTDLLRTAEQTKYEGKGRNIFMAQAEPIPQAQVPVIQQKPQEPIVQGPPPPPPINIKFIGFANRPGEPKQIFLVQNEDVFVAKEGDIVNRRYKVTKINPSSVEIEDVLNNNHQSIPLSQS